MYYIYHIPGVKIGCSTEPAKRVAKQGFTDYTILEEHSCIYEVSKREHELQREWGYPVDISPYYNSRQQWGANAGSYESRSAGGKSTWQIHREYMLSIVKIAGTLGSKEDKSKAGKIGNRNQPRKAKVKGGQNIPLEARIRGGANGCKIAKSNGVKKTNAIQIQCPHCNKIANPGNYKQYHGNNCKHKPT